MIQNMTSGNPVKLIIQFTIPLLIGNVFQQLYSISDIIIVGRLLGVNSLAAVGATGPLFFLLLAVTIGFTSGLTVITAQRFGANDFNAMRRSAATATVISTAFTLIFSLILIAFLRPILRLMNVPEEIFGEALAFISIIAYGLVMIVFYNLLSGIIRALGDSRTPLYFLIFASIINIGLNLFLIYVCGMGVEGSALGTVLALSISVICCYFYIVRKFPILHLKKSDWKLDWNFSKEHLALAIPMAVQFSIIALSSMVIQSVCNSFGPLTIAAFTSAMRIEQLAAQPMVSFGVAMATYTAQNYGAGLIGRVRRGVFNCSMISLGVSIFMAVIIFTAGENLVEIFTKERNEIVIDTAKMYLNISVLFYFFLGQIFVYRNALQGLGKPVIPLISSIVELGMRSFAAIVLAYRFGFIGVCYASPIAWIGGAAVVSVGYYMVIRRIGRKYLFCHHQVELPWH
ncbi:MAG: MATE family efflux transporter [Pseudomonadota bacterium]|nr:MATE family efflux transporter [Pseudomonadota bacterium]